METMPKKHPTRYAKNLEEAALSLGVSKQTLMGWGQASGCPCKREHKVPDFGYDLVLLRRWAVENGYAVDAVTGRISGNRSGRRSEDSMNGNPSLVFKTAQADEKRAKARLVQLELKAKEGELVSVEEVQEHAVKVHRFMRESLLSWARSCGPKLAGKDALTIQQEARELVEDLMRGLSGEVEQ